MNESSAREGIHSLFELYANDIYRFARFTLHDEAEAKDVVQEVFFRAFQQWDSFRNESSYKTWLLTIARNYMYDLFRKRKRQLKLFDKYTPPEQDHKYKQIDDLIVLQEGIARLKAIERQAVVLRHVQGLPIAEVAVVMGWTEGKTRVKLHRALRKLRDLIDDNPSLALKEGRGIGQ